MPDFVESLSFAEVRELTSTLNPVRGWIHAHSLWLIGQLLYFRGHPSLGL